MRHAFQSALPKGERALETINFRKTHERMNVWVAYLNLEHQYGTEKSLMALFQR